MIDLLDLAKFSKNLKPVKNSEYYIRPGEYHPEGLFSEIIFGPEESPNRKKTFSYIELNCQVIHPTIYNVFKRLDRKIESYISTEKRFSLDEAGRLIEDPNGVTGLNEFIKIFPKIKLRGGDLTRDELIKKVLREHKNESLFIDVVPVIPPEYRKCFIDMSGQISCDPMNDYYVSLIRKASQAKQFSKGSEIYDLFNYEMQKAVIDHDNYIKKLIQKKHGLIRSQLLSKRTDFSGRAVIISDPNLKVNDVGIPLRMAVKLFEPFIMHRIFNSKFVDREVLGKEVEEFTGLKLSVDTIKSILKSISNADTLPDVLYQHILQIVKEATETRVVILKRDPVLHAEGVRGFNVKIREGKTIHLSNYHTGGFNADYDGDTMAIYHPVTDEAQEEIRTKMMRSESGDNYKAVSFDLSKEMCVGLFGMTKDKSNGNSPIKVSEEDLDKATDPFINVIYRGQKTTMGRAIFNSCLPVDYPFIDKQVKKGDINGLIPGILTKYGQDQAIKTFSRLGLMGFKFATITSPSITLDELIPPEEVMKIKAQLGKVGPDEGDKLIKQAHDLVVAKLKSNNAGLYDLVESGSTKGWVQPDQMLIAKGITADSQGNILDPIENSFADGLTNTQFFKAASGARKGIIDRVINTADTGYLSRQLAYVLNSVEIDRTLNDCKTKRTLDIKLSGNMGSKFVGRNVINRGRVSPFKPDEYKTGDVVNFRTPILCESPKICHTCYGKLLERHRTPYAGVLAAQIIGEAGTQTIMRTFHTGGAVKIIRKNMVDDAIQNDPYSVESIVKECFIQRENLLYAKTDLVMTIDVDEYPMPDDVIINDEDNKIFAKSLVATVQSDKGDFNIILDYTVVIQYLDNMEYLDKRYIKLTYKADDLILETPMEADITKELLRYAQRLIGGKVVYKDVNHLYLKLLKVYGDLRSMDSIHLEILLSQVLRDKTNDSIPARLGKKWDPTLMNIKSVVFKTSFIQGLEFENINKAIEVGLITKEPEEQSILEKILFGTLVVDKKKKGYDND